MGFDRGWRRFVVLLILFFHLNEVPDGCKIWFYSNNFWDFACLWSLPYCDCRIVISSHIEAKIERGEFKYDKVQKERKPLIPSIHHSIVIALRLSYISQLFLTSVKGSAITHRIQSCQKCQNLHQRDMESTNVTVCVCIKWYLRDLFPPPYTSSCVKAGCAYLCSQCRGWWVNGCFCNWY